MSDEKTETANPTPTPRPRFSINGPGKPYIIFAIAMTLAIGAASIINFYVLALFLIASPIWLLGHALIALGGTTLNKGETASGRRLINFTCAIVFVLMLGLDQISFILAVADPGYGNMWKLDTYVISIPIYLACLGMLFLYSILSSRSRQ